jgi:general stress protein 26
MSSIDKNKKEDNFENLIGREGVEKVRELLKKADTCLFCTAIETTKSFETRPMSPQEVDESGTIWFLSSKDSHKNLELEKNPKAQLLFQGFDNSIYLSLYGKVKISQNKSKIKELWDPSMKAWLPEGENDPKITILEFIPEEGYYWDTKNGIAVATVKRLFGTIAGKNYDDSLQGKIKV